MKSNKLNNKNHKGRKTNIIYVFKKYFTNRFSNTAYARTPEKTKKHIQINGKWAHFILINRITINYCLVVQC